MDSAQCPGSFRGGRCQRAHLIDHNPDGQLWGSNTGFDSLAKILDFRVDVLWQRFPARQSFAARLIAPDWLNGHEVAEFHLPARHLADVDRIYPDPFLRMAQTAVPVSGF